MFTRKTVLSTVAFLLLFITSKAFSSEYITFDFSNLWKNNPQNSQISSTPPLVPAKFVKFKGGNAIGNIASEDSLFKISGKVGFLLSGNEKGGVLRIDFATINKKQITGKIKTYPSSILEAQEIVFSGKPLEMLVPPAKSYILLDVSGDFSLQLNRLEFIEKEDFDEERDCQRVILN